MQAEIKTKISDITFIGSGISSSFTILHFLDKLEATPDATEKIHITIIDKYSEFHTGIPYGSRSGYSVHLITSLKNFLPEPELSKFIKWLNENKGWLLDNLRKEGGDLSVEWMQTHAQKIENNDWEDLFIPRRFFGCYIEEKVNSRLDKFRQEGRLEISCVTGEVIDIEKEAERYHLSLKNEQVIVSHKVVLSVGSLPVNHLWKDEDLIEEDNLLFANDPYKPELAQTLQKIDAFSEGLGNNTPINVLIVGANASGLEMLYKLNDIAHIKSRIHKFSFLSTQGLLPDSVIDTEKRKEYIPEHLKALADKESLTAQEIANAAYKDLDHADEINLGAASTVEIVSKAFGALLGKLDTVELRKFACFHGNEIGRRQRCAGFHYSKTVDALKAEGRFNHIAGRFRDLKKNDNGDYVLEYLDTQTKTNLIDQDPVHIIINCVGSTNLSKENIPVLLQNMIKKGYAKANDSNIGFEVNEDLETLPNLHIMGPLLAGNIFDGKAVWHLEHCGRIIWLSKVLSEKFSSYFLNTVE